VHHLSAEQQLFILYQIRNWVFVATTLSGC